MSCSITPSRAAGRCGCAGCWRACRAKSRAQDQGRVQAPRRKRCLMARWCWSGCCEAGDIKDVVISAYGLREGLLYARLCRRKSAPRIRWWNSPAPPMRAMARVPAHAHEMFDWTAPLFDGRERRRCARVREASACFSDIGWRRHPDDRAIGAFGQVLTAPFAGADHRARALIATRRLPPLFRRRGFPRKRWHRRPAGQGRREARPALGLAWRFAFSLSASAAGELAHYPLRLTPAKVMLEVPAPARSHRRRAGAEAAGRAGRGPGPQGRNTGRLTAAQPFA